MGSGQSLGKTKIGTGYPRMYVTGRSSLTQTRSGTRMVTVFSAHTVFARHVVSVLIQTSCATAIDPNQPKRINARIATNSIFIKHLQL